MEFNGVQINALTLNNINTNYPHSYGLFLLCVFVFTCIVVFYFDSMCAAHSFTPFTTTTAAAAVAKNTVTIANKLGRKNQVNVHFDRKMCTFFITHSQEIV